MKKNRASESSCDRCQFQCRSWMAAHRKKDDSDFDQINRQFAFKNGQNLPFVRDQRVGFYCIQSGYVRLNFHTKSNFRAVRVAGPGDIVGYVNCVSESYSATALHPVVACFFDIKVFFILQERAPALGQDIIKWLCELIVTRDQRTIALEGRSAKARIAGALADLAQRFGRPGPNNSIEIIPVIDRKTLSDLTSTAIETTSRTISEMETARILERRGRSLCVLDPKALRDYK